MNITKIDFLKEYVKKRPNISAKDASDMLNLLWEELPKNAKNLYRKNIVDAIDMSLLNIVQEVLEAIADCPYIKIEIVDYDRLNKLENDMEFVKSHVLSLDGYIDGLSTRIRNCESKALEK